jgi:hypothetical protein
VGDILMTRQEGTREFVGLPKELRAGDGNHEIPPLAPGGRVASFFVWSRSQGTARIDFPHGIREGEVIDVKLSPVQEISGRVLDRAGDPVAEADIFGSAPGLLVDLTSALRGSGRSFKQLEGHTCTGVARTSPDGTFHILAPSTDGLLVVLAGSRGGTLYRYSTARAVDVVTIDAATPVTIHRSGPSPVEQTVRLFSSHPEIRMWVGERWPASDPSTTILAPLPGPYRVNLLRESGADGQWVGISGSARVDVTGGPTPIAVTLTEGSHPR